MNPAISTVGWNKLDQDVDTISDIYRGVLSWKICWFVDCVQFIRTMNTLFLHNSVILVFTQH